jgi:hypothetical protein
MIKWSRGISSTSYQNSGGKLQFQSRTIYSSQEVGGGQATRQQQNAKLVVRDDFSHHGSKGVEGQLMLVLFLLYAVQTMVHF